MLVQGLAYGAWGPYECSSMFAEKKGSSSFISLLRDLRTEHSLEATTTTTKTTVTQHLHFKTIDSSFATSIKYDSYALSVPLTKILI